MKKNDTNLNKQYGFLVEKFRKECKNKQKYLDSYHPRLLFFIHLWIFPGSTKMQVLLYKMRATVKATNHKKKNPILRISLFMAKY